MTTGTLDTAGASRAAVQPRSGADRCPTTTALHRADDGLIARIRIPGGQLTAEQAQAVAAVAAPGDSIELTARGNLQLRGLTDEAADRATAAIHAAGLTPSPAHDRARTIVASPLIGRCAARHTGASAGIDDDFIRALDAAICASADTKAVSGRVFTVVDDGSGHALAPDADLVVRWNAAARCVDLQLGGRRAGSTTVDDGPARAAALLGALATAAAAHGAWRARELATGALGAAIAAAHPAVTCGAVTASGSDAATETGATPAELPVGITGQPDGRFAVRAIAVLGRLTGDQLRAAAQLARRHGAGLRIDHARGVTFVDLAAADAAAVTSTLTALGLLTDAGDPGIGLTACAGRSCTRTDVDVRGAARLRLAQRRAGAAREHLVGCERRCGAPRDGDTVIAEAGDSAARLALRAARTIDRAAPAPPAATPAPASQEPTR